MHQEEVAELMKIADIFIGVGTSAQVYPAAGLLLLFRGTKTKYFIDPHPAYEALQGFEVLTGAASEKMPRLVERIMEFQ